MSEQTSVTVYDPMAKTIHWIVAFAVFIMFGTALMMEAAPDELKPLVYLTHKSTGLVVLLLMLLRVVWFHFHARPPLPVHLMPVWQVHAARIVHGGLYLLSFLIPLVGWALVSAGPHGLSFFGFFDVPLMPIASLTTDYPELRGALGETHEILATLFAGLIVVHIGATFLHHFVEGDDVLMRIAPVCTHRWLRRMRGG